MYDDNDHMFFLLADASLKEVEVGWGLRRPYRDDRAGVKLET